VTAGRGRPPLCPRELAVRVIHLRYDGLSYRQIADMLNAEGVLTPLVSSHWLKSHVDRLLHTRYVMSLAEEIVKGQYANADRRRLSRQGSSVLN
jgi:hypothetical protein